MNTMVWNIFSFPRWPEVVPFLVVRRTRGPRVTIQFSLNHHAALTHFRIYMATACSRSKLPWVHLLLFRLSLRYEVVTSVNRESPPSWLISPIKLHVSWRRRAGVPSSLYSRSLVQSWCLTTIVGWMRLCDSCASKMKANCVGKLESPLILLSSDDSVSSVTRRQAN